MESRTTELSATPAVVFGDLRVVGCWLLRYTLEEDFDHFGAHVQRAWQAHHARAAIWSGAAPPAAAAVIGAVATRAAALLAGDDQEAIDVLGVAAWAWPHPPAGPPAWHGPHSSGGSCRTRSRAGSCARLTLTWAPSTASATAR